MSQSPSISHILYVMTGSRGCESALSILKQYHVLKREIHVQDIKLIERPSWLRGVPVLAKVATREIWEGTASIEQLYYLAGYFAGMNNNQNTTPDTQQPWLSYQTNLTLASSTPTPTPAQVSVQTPSISTSQPTMASTLEPQTKSAPITPTNLPVFSNQPPVSGQTILTSPNQAQQPALPNDNNQPQNPDKVQALPLPDELRPKQELVLPPLPKNIKAEQSSTQAVQTRLSDTLNQTSSSPPPPTNKTPATGSSTSNIPSSSIANSSLNTKQSPTANQDDLVPLPTDESSPIFTPQQVDQIQRVMFKPKTVNKRRDATETSSFQTTTDSSSQNTISSTIRVFPVREKRRTTVVEKEDIHDYVNADDESSQPNTLSPILQVAPEMSNEVDEVSNESGTGAGGGA